MSPIDMTATAVTSCPLCGLDGGELFHVESGWRLLRCHSCSFLYVSPRPKESALREHYRGYLPTTREEIRAWDRMMSGIHRRIVRRLQRAARRGRVLEAGCGFGFLLRDLRAAGFPVEGVDISPTALAHARDVLGLPVREGTVEEVGFQAGSFDAVVALYLIEHLPDPISFLEEARRLLRPEGILLIRWPHTTPLVRALQLIGVDLRLYDLPSHLSDFSPRTMRAALQRAGFDRIRTGIVGWTRPPEWWKRWPSRVGGIAAEGLAALTHGRALLPGVSKTTVAYRA